MLANTQGRAVPAALSDPAERTRRRAMLEHAPHVAPIRSLAARIRRDTCRPVPEPDPLDGGAEAALLLLLETPGPRMMQSGIVSRDQPSGTGANLRRFLDAAQIPRRETLIWNAIPWVIHEPGARNRAPRVTELRAALTWLPPLVEAMPKLRIAVLAGRFAAAAEQTLHAARPHLLLRTMPHPSPTFVCTSTEVPIRIMAALSDAAAALRAEPR